MDSKSASSIGLTKVVLYKHGIGYFERRGKVEGPCKIDLVCEASEIDDMLKSLLALTSAGGKIDAITYDSSKTLESRLAEFGFDISSTNGLSELLGQMKGIPVTVSVSGESYAGRVLGLDETELVVHDNIVRDKQLTLYTESSSFKRIALSSISSIKVDDESMASELKQQLELLFQNAKKKDRKALAVSISTAGEQDVLIAYSIPCPIWKTSYRLVMSEDAQVLLQGMAIVDNVQEEDWTDVQIILVSSSPISFIQPLYDPVMPSRPRIAAQGNRSSGPVVAERARVQAPGSAPAPALKAKMRAESASYERADAPTVGGGGGNYGSLNALIAQQSMDAPLEIEAEGKGELFEYRVGKPVTIPRNSSALIPIVQQNVEGERISLYNESKNKSYPHAAIRFINNTGLTLEGGPVTVMEGDIYGGEALLDTVKPDEKRFLLYAVDQSVPVVVRQQSVSRPYWRARSINGTIFVDYNLRNEKTYELENLGDTAKIVYVEHPFQTTWKLVNTVAPAETTENFYRFRVEINAKQAHKLAVHEETESYLQIWIAEPNQLDLRRLEWLCAQNFIDEEFQTFLKTVAEMYMEIQKLNEQQIYEQNMLGQATEAQARARENLKSLGASNERYRKIIDTTEDQITEINARINAISREQMIKQQQYREFAQKQLISQLESTQKHKGN